ncbi:MAG: hypothetical protein H7Y43_00310 [Akkermansiaceae bacterium]|nr:hypothetical protein [Verrucomicrobiales bacterium]
MSASIENWLQRAAAHRGVLACGVRLADRTFLIRSNRQELSLARIEHAVAKLFEASQLIQQNGIPADRLRWNFESGQILFTPRGGGALAALFVNKDIANSEDMENLLAAFSPA